MKVDLASMFNATAVPLRFPRDVEERVHRYVRQHQGGALIAEQAPFRRQLDLWAAAVAVACASGKKPRAGASSSWGKKFVDTRAVHLDPKLADLLVALAAADFGIQDHRLSDATEVAELANRYAAVGVEDLLEWLEDPGLRHTNIDKVIRKLKTARDQALDNAGVSVETQDKSTLEQ